MLVTRREEIPGVEFSFHRTIKRMIDKASTIGFEDQDSVSIEKIEKYRPVPSMIDPDVTVVGVDGGGGGSGKELECGYYSPIMALAYGGTVVDVADPAPLCEGDVFLFVSEEGPLWSSLVERKLTFDVALKAFLLKKPRYLLIDGGLILRPNYIAGFKSSGLETTSNTSYQQCLFSCAKSILSLLAACRGSGTKPIGVVKRPRSSLLVNRGFDHRLLDRVLALGDFTGPLSPGRHPSLGYYKYVASCLGSSYFPCIKVFYQKTTLHRSPIRVEIPSFVDFEEAATLISLVADPLSGIPAHILKADSHARVTQHIMKSLYIRTFLAALENGDSNAFRPMRDQEFRDERRFKL